MGARRGGARVRALLFGAKEPAMPSRAAFVVAVAILPGLAGGQVLQVNSDSLTAYKAGSASAVQDIRPIVLQRCAGIDGALRAGSAQGWAIAGNPFGEGWDGNGMLGSLALATGTHASMEVDIALPAPGAARWVIGRTFNQRQETSGGVHRDSNG